MLLILTLFAATGGGITVHTQESELAERSSTRVVHAAPETGAVDLYIDDQVVLVGLAFGAVSDPIPLAAGDRVVDVVLSGTSPDEPLLTATFTVLAGATLDLALLGSAEAPRLGVFPVDLTPLPPSFARIGAVLDSPDTGPVDLAVTGGDLLFPTIDPGAATEFADVTSGAYDLEVRYGGTEAAFLTLPGTILEEGVVYVLYIVGEAALGEVQAMIASRPAESVTLTGHPAWVQAGDCAAVGTVERAAELTTVAESPFGERGGHPAAVSAESSFTSIAIPYTDLIAESHSMVVAESDQAPESAVACGEIGGTPSVDGSLVIGLRALPGSGTAGIAVLAPNILDPAITDVSVFLADGLLGNDTVPVEVPDTVTGIQELSTTAMATPAAEE